MVQHDISEESVVLRGLREHHFEASDECTRDGGASHPEVEFFGRTNLGVDHIVLLCQYIHLGGDEKFEVETTRLEKSQCHDSGVFDGNQHGWIEVGSVKKTDKHIDSLWIVICKCNRPCRRFLHGSKLLAILLHEQR